MRYYDIQRHESQILPINGEYLDDFKHPDRIPAWIKLLFLTHQYFSKRWDEPIARGQFITTYADLERDLSDNPNKSLTKAQLQLILKKLKQANEIDTKRVGHRVKITIKNYERATNGGQESNLPEHTGYYPKNHNSHIPVWRRKK